MPPSRSACLLSFIVTALWGGLGCSGQGGDGSNNEDGGGGAAATCARDSDCDDGLFCSGEERCDPDHEDADVSGCVFGEVPCDSDSLRCSEDAVRCITECTVTRDADGDGSLSQDCGGADCDDTDVNRYPGNFEVCDVEDHDEDCDPSTFGVRDQDGDGAPDATCCNVDDNDQRYCGSDCDDTRPGTHPNVPEVCDGIDNDCDGDVDEGVTRVAYLDEDGDGYGDPRYPMDVDCTEQSGISDNSADCDDSSPDVAPGAVELCDGIDNNCDGIYERDLDEDGHLEPGSVCVDGDLPLDDCNNLDGTTYDGAPELCDGYDNDCDGVRDDAFDAARSCSAAEDLSGAFCKDRTCEIVACRLDRGDCNRNALDGCEIDLSSDESNCGQCGSVCPLGTTCMAGACTKATLIAVSVGSDHACALSDTGAVGCWGENEFSQLGRGNGYPARGMVSVVGLGDVVDVTTGKEHSCALDASGDVYCWGRGAYQQLGLVGTAERSIPTLVGSDFDSIASGGRGTCAVKDGVATCWGRELVSLDSRTPTPSAVAYSGNVVSATVSDFSHCAALESGVVECAGDVLTAGDFDEWTNPPTCGYRNLGDDSLTIFYCVPSPLQVPNISAATQVSGTCLLQDNAVLCLNGNGTQERIPADATTSTVTKISANAEADVCALYESGEVICSLPYVAANLTPTSMNLSGPAVSVSVGEEATCFVTEAGVECIGSGPVLGRLPQEPYSGVKTITPAHDLLSLDPLSHCARTSSGETRCATSDPRTFAVNPALSGVLALEGGRRFTCGLFFDGSVGCEGANGEGQLGSAQGEEFRLVDVPPASQLASNGKAVCVTTQEGEIWCWGTSSQGNLGVDAPFSAPNVRPTRIPDLEGVVAVGLGSRFGCALLDVGTVSCWGENDQGELGDGTGRDSVAPVPVSLLDEVIRLEVGAQFACALRHAGTVHCWGSDQRGQLGQGGALGQSRIPVQIPGLRDVTEISLGRAHGCAVQRDGTTYCWGSNSEGQVGVGTLPTSATSSEPVSLLPNLTTTHLSARGHSTCVIDSTGAPLCWGGDFQEMFMADETYGCTLAAYEDNAAAYFPLCPEPTPVTGL